jgi:disulfide bond formation protein DsbB
MSKDSAQIDPRGPRFTASITLAVFAVVLLTAPSTVAVVLLSVQTAFFAIGAGRGVQFTPTAYVFKKLIRPRLSAPSHLEDAAPPRFAQTVGLVFTAVALVGFATNVDPLGYVFTGFAVIAAFLNAVFGFCLGCELYLLGKRISSRSTNTTTPNETNKEEVAA